MNTLNYDLGSITFSIDKDSTVEFGQSAEVGMYFEITSPSGETTSINFTDQTVGSDVFTVKVAMAYGDFHKFGQFLSDHLQETK